MYSIFGERPFIFDESENTTDEQELSQRSLIVSLTNALLWAIHLLCKLYKLDLINTRSSRRRRSHRIFFVQGSTLVLSQSPLTA